MYDPAGLRKKYIEMERGRARMSGIRTAIEAADQYKDVPYQIYFRIQFCNESMFYGDDLDMVVMFPELLALADRHPDAPVTQYNRGFGSSMAHVMWVYKWLLDACTQFYQIPMEDCMKFFEDYKERCLGMGYSLRPYYGCLYYFYDCMGSPKSEEAFAMFERMPHDRNSNCRACERNQEIEYYLDHDNLQQAVRLSREIENFTLTCGSEEKYTSWLRMKKHFLQYYVRKKDEKKIVEYSRLIERHMNREREFACWDDFMEGYAYADIGKALKIYKNHWKDWLTERCPADIYECNRSACVFFRELKKDRKGEFIKIPFDGTFPLYVESGRYRIEELYQFHYDRARDIAEKFDARNGTDAYCKRLEELAE